MSNLLPPMLRGQTTELLEAVVLARSRGLLCILRELDRICLIRSQRPWRHSDKNDCGKKDDNSEMVYFLGTDRGDCSCGLWHSDNIFVKLSSTVNRFIFTRLIKYADYDSPVRLATRPAFTMFTEFRVRADELNSSDKSQHRQNLLSFALTLIRMSLLRFFRFQLPYRWMLAIADSLPLCIDVLEFTTSVLRNENPFLRDYHTYIKLAHGTHCI
jgi:hypothetical protein